MTAGRSATLGREGVGLVAALVVALLSGGCEFVGEVTSNVVNQCAVATDCPGATCDTEAGRCVATAPDGYELVIEVTPPADTEAGASLPRRFYFPDPDDLFSDTQGDAGKLAVAGGITVVGDVCVGVTDGSDPFPCEHHVSANLTFTEVADVPEEAHTTSVLTSPRAATAIDGQLTDFTVRLLQGRDYDVTVEPIGEDASRAYPVATRIRVPEAGDVTRISLMPWDPEAPTFLGELFDLALEEAVAGLRVVAIDRESGIPVSSAAISDDNGNFLLVLHPAASDDFLLIMTAPSGSRGPYPQVVQDTRHFFPGAAKHEIEVPGVETFAVQGQVTAPDGTLLADAVVSIESTEDIPLGTTQIGVHRVRTVTNEDGTFTADLVPAKYEIVVTPPVGREDTTVLVVARDYTEPPDDPPLVESFTTPRRAQLVGSVTTFSQTPMPDVRVVAAARRRDGPDDDVPARFNRSNNRSTGADGTFALPLDQGLYDVTLRPPSGSGFSWLVFPDQWVVENAVPAEPVALPAPVLLHGVLVRADGVAIPGADVEVFAVVEDVGIGQRFIPVGRTVADDDGRFRFPIPPHL